MGGGGMGRGGMRRGGSRRGGAGGRGGSGGEGRSGRPAPELRDNADSPEFKEQMRSDLNCLLAALFLAGTDFAPGEFVYAGQMDIDAVKADSLKVKAGEGSGHGCWHGNWAGIRSLTLGAALTSRATESRSIFGAASHVPGRTQ